MPGRAFNEIFEIAADQYGFVTTTQAREQGVSPQALVMMARRGTLAQVSRGVYRVAQFPQTRFDPYMEAILWPSPATAALSHESALEVFEISDASSPKVHITVPTSFRTRRYVPDHIQLHRGLLGESDLIVREGLRITNAERTILDCHSAAVGPAVVRQAIDDAERKGLITRPCATRLREICL